MKFKLTRFEWGIGITYFVFFLADMISTLIIDRRLLDHIETNPLFVLTNQFWPLILANIFLMCFLVYIYKTSNPTHRFFVITFMVWLTIIRILVIYHNYAIFLDPPTIAAVQHTTSSQKLDYTFSYVLIYLVIPVLLSHISYLIFSLDHEIKNKKKPR